ncbi:MAG: hypothetical protein AABW50_00090 [Nanoarchaeota archaeon]
MIEEKSVYSGMSKPEREVATYLQELNLYWKYEHPIFVYDEKERPRVWTPDFFLPELGIYVEVCGVDRDDYSYREEIYKKNRVQVIFIHFYKEENGWKKFLKSRVVDIADFRSKKVTDSLMQQK